MGRRRRRSAARRRHLSSRSRHAAKRARKKGEKNFRSIGGQSAASPTPAYKKKHPLKTKRRGWSGIRGLLARK